MVQQHKIIEVTDKKVIYQEHLSEEEIKSERKPNTLSLYFFSEKDFAKLKRIEAQLHAELSSKKK